ncbi:hypothetical protein PCASD_23370 [Puccinia coronata f. sp. avenae]|uniref:Uncharacterized protein n=1 Tax=Puccinia coronata f. sp. avenae TaxID=200324 RepID=A0A2N5SGX9_9BASI|nr:hypothetical protein PCASD_23370 [Puccinia coronata f. sp. avenae]
MDIEPANVASPETQIRVTQAHEKLGHRSKDDGCASTAPPSSSRSKGRGTKSRLITVGGNRFESPSHSSRFKAESSRSAGSRRANLASNEWLSGSLEENPLSPRNTTKIIDKEIASQYNDMIGDPFLEDQPTTGPSPNNASMEPNPGTNTSSESQLNPALETTNISENPPNTAIASPPGSPKSSSSSSLSPPKIDS